jgi:similar to stage IV sporulation protein
MDKAKYTVEAPIVFALNTLVRRGFNLKKLKTEHRKITFFINADRCKEIEHVMQKCNLKFTLNYVTGAKTRGVSLLKRYGIVAGLVVAVVLIVLYSMVVTGVEINGLENVESGAIYARLADEGVKFPAFRPNNDLEKLRLKIVEIEGVSGVSLSFRGTRLVINVAEELSYNPQIDTQTPIAVTAAHCGVVTRLVVIQGTPLVKIGDTVKKGDVIIAPYTVNAEGVQTPLRAMGEVYATVWFQNHFYYNDTAIASVRTGETAQKTTVSILGFTSLPKSPFDNYEYEQEVKRVAAIVPYQIIKTTFFKTERRQVPFDFELNAPEIVKNETEKLVAASPAGVPESAKTWHVVKKLDNVTILSIYYEIEMNISV